MQINGDKQLDLRNYYTSSDLGCCSALITAGYELEKLDKTNPRKTVFLIVRDEGIDDTVNRFWANQLQVDARTFFENIKMLKSRIYSEE